MKRTDLDNKIIIVCGKAQSGKSTTCDYLNNKLLNSKIFNFADELKLICYKLFGVNIKYLYGSNEEKNNLTEIQWSQLPCCTVDFKNKFNDKYLTIRELLQVLGTNIFRKMYYNCWVQSTYNNICNSFKKYSIIADCRFPNEIDFLVDKKTHDVIVIKLNRNPLNLTHYSETALDNFNWSKIEKLIEIDNTHLSLDQKNELVYDNIQEILF
jgi:hypothetical protein